MRRKLQSVRGRMVGSAFAKIVVVAAWMDIIFARLLRSIAAVAAHILCM